VWLQSNNPIYNLHSVVRFACFSYFFIALPQPVFKTFKKIIAAVFVLFGIINFTFFENFFYPNHLSGNILSASFLTGTMTVSTMASSPRAREGDEGTSVNVSAFALTCYCADIRRRHA